MFETEEWRPLEEFPHYLISSYGRVKHVNHIEPRAIKANERGFPVILLSSATTATRYMRQINHLVARTFLPPPLYEDETSVWHKDGDLLNCHVSNLMWERRDRVLEWNDMHRRGVPKHRTPMVKNNRTGEIYKDAYDCAMHEGDIEVAIISKIEKNRFGDFDENARYRYVLDKEVQNGLR